jgi:quercetin dioxygenase-like cupin family protein
MKRKAILLTLVLTLGIAFGVIGSQVISKAQQQPARNIVLQRADLVGIEGKEGLVVLTEIAPGEVGAKHYHSGNQFGYVLDGSMIMDIEGKPPVTYKPGEAYYLLPKQVHSAKNVSGTAPVKVLAFAIAEKGQPFNVPVK